MANVVLEKPWLGKWGKGKRFGGGGQGDTYLVSSKDNSQAVMKLLRKGNERNRKCRQRMHHEASNLDYLHGAGASVPAVLDGNTAERENLDVPLFFVMECVEGQTLAELIKQRKCVSLPAATSMVLNLCDTFQIAFDEGISHRDIKPENLIVRSSDESKIVVVDFGLSFNEDSTQQLTEVDEAFDNKFISLPERRGPGENKRDPRSDITGICAIYFYCLTGCAPRHLRDSKGRPPHRWEGKTMKDVDSTPIQTARLNALFDRGFDVEIQNRFQTPGELKLRLQEILRSDPLPTAEDVGAVAIRQSNILRQTDRKTLLAEVKRKSLAAATDLNTRIGDIQKKLEGSLFKFVHGGTLHPFPKEYGDDLFNWQLKVHVENHEAHLAIQYLFTCNKSECQVFRRIFGSADDSRLKYHSVQPDEVVLRFDGRLGVPDTQIIAADLERSIGEMIPKLREFISNQPAK